MKPIIQAIEKKLLKKELKKEFFLRITNNAQNQLYAFTAHDCPNLMLELGRLREQTFRDAGGGTGQEVDVDYYDTCKQPYTQLIVWNPREEEIVGGYRFIKCAEAQPDEKGNPELATVHMFNFSDLFIKKYLPHTIELGRSFVQTKYQATKENRIGLFALDNLWDGLGALIMKNPKTKYFFGKITMYKHFNKEARNILLYFMYKHFPDKLNLVTPIKPVFNYHEHKNFDTLFTFDNFKDNYKVLLNALKEYDEIIPPLFNAYMKLTSTMVTFGTSDNKNFGDVEETGIMITIKDILPSKKERHLDF